ncbi:MAG: class I SAM-dependent methyltransferase [Acidobacteria bacterium]|nr:class I SAM-dependent methyltransferase [Acidobacteriota bacterium]
MKGDTLTAQAAYELWADTYPPIAHNPLMRVEQDIVARLIAQQRATRALDVGTGSGRYLPLLASTGARVVVGLDFSRAMLARCAPGANRGFVRADACRLPFRRAAFDLINASLMVGDVCDLGAWSREMARTLTYGGHLIYSDFHPSWAQHAWRRTFHDADGQTHEMSLQPHAIDDHLAALEAAGLQVLAIREPRFEDNTDASVKTFRRQWGNPPVVVVFHAVTPRGPQ